MEKYLCTFCLSTCLVAALGCGSTSPKPPASTRQSVAPEQPDTNRPPAKAESTQASAIDKESPPTLKERATPPMTEDEILANLDGAIAAYGATDKEHRKLTFFLVHAENSDDKTATEKSLDKLDLEQHKLLTTIYEIYHKHDQVLVRRAENHKGVLPPDWWNEEPPCPDGAILKGDLPAQRNKATSADAVVDESLPLGTRTYCQKGSREYHGPYTEFHLNGFKKVEVFYENDQKQKAQILWHDNGQVQQKVDFRNDKEQGSYRTFHRNGMLNTDGSYQKGLPHGTFKVHDMRGKLLGTYKLRNGNGTVRHWHDNGQLKREVKLKNNMPVGRGTLYDETGKKLR